MNHAFRAGRKSTRTRVVVHVARAEMVSPRLAARPVDRCGAAFDMSRVLKGSGRNGAPIAGSAERLVGRHVALP